MKFGMSFLRLIVSNLHLKVSNLSIDICVTNMLHLSQDKTILFWCTI